MKESIAMKLAQRAVLNDSGLLPNEKLSVLEVLMNREIVAQVMEKYEEEQEKAE